MSQQTLEGKPELVSKVEESLSIIKETIRRSSGTPIVINFSGGKDSLVLLDLAKNITDNFVCFYTISGIEFPECVPFARKVCESFGQELVTSVPEDHKGDFWSRLETFGYWPTVRKTWCSRDLKFRPQHKKLKRLYGNQVFYKLNGVRRYESTRRNSIHISTQRLGFMIPDYNVSKDIMVFPILNWSNRNVKDYLKQNKITIPTNPLYEKYSVSGCYYCPFYQPSIYLKILKYSPNILDKIIEWENKLNQPAGSGYTWIRDLHKSILAL